MVDDLNKTTIDRRQQILTVALHAFSHAGYHSTSMTDIASALEVTKPVLYQYFDSKRELYLELLHFVGNDLVRVVTESVEQAHTGYQQTERGMIAYFSWVSHNTAAFSLLTESSARVDEEFTDIVREFEDLAAAAIAPFIAAEVTETDQKMFAIGLVGMAETVSRQLIRTGRTIDPVELGTTMAKLAWGGLRSVGLSRHTDRE